MTIFLIVLPFELEFPDCDCTWRVMATPLFSILYFLVSMLTQINGCKSQNLRDHPTRTLRVNYFKKKKKKLKNNQIHKNTKKNLHDRHFHLNITPLTLISITFTPSSSHLISSLREPIAKTENLISQ